MSVTTATIRNNFAFLLTAEFQPSVGVERETTKTKNGQFTVIHQTAATPTGYRADADAWVFGEIQIFPEQHLMTVTAYTHATPEELKSAEQTADLWSNRLDRIPGTWVQLEEGRRYGALLAREVVCPPPAGWVRMDDFEDTGDRYTANPGSDGEDGDDSTGAEPSHMLWREWTPETGVRLNLAPNFVDTEGGFTLASMKAFHAALGAELESMAREFPAVA